MKVTVYGIRNCDTMKKVFAWLDRHGIEYRFHDYRRDGVPTEPEAIKPRATKDHGDSVGTRQTKNNMYTSANRVMIIKNARAQLTPCSMPNADPVLKVKANSR